jgi:hypothetical protein
VPGIDRRSRAAARQQPCGALALCEMRRAVAGGVGGNRTGRIGQLKANGMTVLAPSPELVEGLRRIGGTLAEEWQVGAGSDGVAILQAYRASLGK